LNLSLTDHPRFRVDTIRCFVFWVFVVVSCLFGLEMGSHYVANVGLELLSSTDVPILASQLAEITGMCHHTQVLLLFL
jgi:hypothetical protein